MAVVGLIAVVVCDLSGIVVVMASFFFFYRSRETVGGGCRVRVVWW